MNITKYGEKIKIALATELQKIGLSIFDFEKALQGLDNPEGISKTADIGSKLLENVSTSATTGIPEALLKATLAGGVVSGMTFDELDKSVEETNKAILREQQKLDLVRRMTANIKKEHGLI
jgi:hypothetical protein